MKSVKEFGSGVNWALGAIAAIITIISLGSILYTQKQDVEVKLRNSEEARAKLQKDVLKLQSEKTSRDEKIETLTRDLEAAKQAPSPDSALKVSEFEEETRSLRAQLTAAEDRIVALSAGMPSIDDGKKTPEVNPPNEAEGLVEEDSRDRSDKVLSNPDKRSFKLTERSKAWASPDRTATVYIETVSKKDNSAEANVRDFDSKKKITLRPGATLSVASKAGVYRFVVRRVGGNYVELNEY